MKKKQRLDIPENLKALDDRRITMAELPFFEYCGDTFGKAIFRNIITGEYLD